jgi:hypothetical protein
MDQQGLIKCSNLRALTNITATCFQQEVGPPRLQSAATLACCEAIIVNQTLVVGLKPTVYVRTILKTKHLDLHTSTQLPTNILQLNRYAAARYQLLQPRQQPPQ